MKRIRSIKQPFAITLLLSIVFQLLLPLSGYSLTGGPSMPEYRSFEPVATTNMVSNFDGSFTYNVPLLDVPNGYPLNLSYHSKDVNNEAQASWVGLGWTLNPGAINRVKRGFPDEYNGATVTYHNRMPANWTISGGAGLGFEFISNENTASIGASIRYNNYNGVGTSVNAAVGICGVVSMDFDYAQGRFGFNPEVNPAALFYKISKLGTAKKEKISSSKALDDYLAKLQNGDDSRESFEAAAKEFGKELKAKGEKTNANQISLGYGNFGFSGSSNGIGSSITPNSPISFPTTSPKYHGFMANVKVDVGLMPLNTNIKPEVQFSGGFSIQKNKEVQGKKTFGYMHNEDGDNEASSMMDYFTENDSPYEKRDNILGYPVPNNDVYNVSGEGTSGTFRPFRSEYGTYRVDRSYSDDIQINVGIDQGIGVTVMPLLFINATISTGVEVGGSYHWLDIGDWDQSKLTSADDYKKFIPQNDVKYTSNENWYFRYSGDLGGNHDLTKTDAAFKANLIPGLLRAKLDYNGWSQLYGPNTNSFVNSKENKRRSAYIDFNNRSSASKSVNNFRYDSYEKKLTYLYEDNGSYKIMDYDLNYLGTSKSDDIQELASTNADGITYIYGLPVYSKNEKQLSYSLKEGDYSSGQLSTYGYQYIPSGNISNTNIDNEAKRKLGYESNTPYVTTHLLTQIVGPDYIDRTMDGPTNDDFGSYTKFNYVKLFVNPSNPGDRDNQYYPFRDPYDGLNFNYGSLSSNKDDMGNFNYGEKEIYFVRSVESKTHVAIFTLENRDDGKSAYLDANPSASDLIKGKNINATRKSLKKLTKIDLYSKSDLDIVNGDYVPKNGATPIKTVRFDYDYSLCNNIPNNSSGGGKLTLKKLWFEYEGKLTSKISPYEFSYLYPTITYPSPYTSLSKGAVYNNQQQNPSYNPINTDRWGNYRNFSGLSTNLGELSYVWNYVNQHYDAAYDPAAYCLKAIKLPSGGEIHIQYEENDYMYVQDQKASVMVPLKNNTSSDEGGASMNGKPYYLDVSKLGINWPQNDPSAQGEIAKELFAPMINKKERMYFNFLYALIGNDSPSLASKKSEYIDGYARINSFGYDDNGPYFTFKGVSSTGTNTVINYGSNVSHRELPHKVCSDFYNTQRRGMINGESNTLDASVDNGATPRSIAQGFVTLLQSLTTLNSCAKFSPEKSYVRLQMPSIMVGKKGGGVRVSKLLMYDSGVESGADVLYGQSYSYTTTEGGKTISSGVATNEPDAGRKENSLVKIIEKDAQSTFNAILFGRDLQGQEGPLGESLLPPPSVGYSKVTVRPIHQGRTSTGSEVYEFFTCKDVPFKILKTSIEKELDLPINIGFASHGFSFSYKHRNPYMSQGYSFISNSMHGQAKRIAKYAQGNDATPMAEEKYEYFTTNEEVKIIDESLNISTVPIGTLGKESEILSERRQVTDMSIGARIGQDVTVGVGIFFIPPFYFPIVVPALPPYKKFKGGISIDEKIVHTHVTSKIITYPAIVKRITNTSDGLTNVTENLVFDKFTGKPIITKTYDEFENAQFKSNYLTQEFKATYSHPNLRPKYLNNNVNSFANLQFSSGNYNLSFAINVAGTTVCYGNELKKFVKGDLIEVVNGANKALFHIDEINASTNTINLIPSGMMNGTVNSSLVGQLCDINVVRSGYTNELNSSQGSVMFNLNKNSQSGFLGIVNGPATNSTSLNPILVQFLADINSAFQTVASGPVGGVQTVQIPSGVCAQLDGVNSSLTITTTSSPSSELFSFRIAKTGQTGNTINIASYPEYTDGSTYYSAKCNDNNFLPISFNNLSAYGFELSYSSGKYNLVFREPQNLTTPCQATILRDRCISFCNDYNYTNPYKAISASAVNYTDVWDYTSADFPILTNVSSTFVGNKYENGKAGKWRPYESYVYRAKLDTDGESKNFEKGSFTLDNTSSPYKYFDWSIGAINNSKWVYTSKSTIYHPNGSAIEDKNILGIRSTAKYGYNYSLPVLVAKNAANDAVAFEGFENTYTVNSNTYFEDNIQYVSTNGLLNTTVAHTGKYSVNLVNNNSYTVASLNPPNSVAPVYNGWSDIMNNHGGLQLRVWVYTAKNTSNEINNNFYAIFGTDSKLLKPIETVGAWTLYEAKYYTANLPTGALDIKLKAVTGANSVYIDDVRIQPLKSEMTCYVYDKAQRLIATFDDQHFSSQFEFNAEGLLVRKLKETSKGLKTISETQYNSKGTNR